MTTPDIFTHRCVNDLAWVIQSPPVISGNINQTRWLSQSDCEFEYQCCLPMLRQLDKNPEPLLNLLSPLKPYVIGDRFECLMRYWLIISPNFKLLAHNKVIQGKLATLGEVDFFIRELSSQKIIHLEVAVKFYLGIGDLAKPSQWYGTHLKDRLDIKLDRMINHQTQLAKKYPDLMPYTIDESWCLLKGRMFLPFEHKNTLLPFAKGCLMGQWLYAHQRDKSHTLQKIDKSHWLANITEEQTKPWVLESPLKHSLCVAKLHNGKESQRYFILPDLFWKER